MLNHPYTLVGDEVTWVTPVGLEVSPYLLSSAWKIQKRQRSCALRGVQPSSRYLYRLSNRHRIPVYRRGSSLFYLLLSRVNSPESRTPVVHDSRPISSARPEPLARSIDWGLSCELRSSLPCIPYLWSLSHSQLRRWLCDDDLNEISSGEQENRYAHDPNGRGKGRPMLACTDLVLRDRKSTRLNSSHRIASRMPSSA